MEKFITKHTPGEWVADDWGDGIKEMPGKNHQYCTWRIHVGKNGPIVGEVIFDTSGAGFGYISSFEEAEANAKLIAAARLLLSALIKYVEDEEYHMLGGAPAPSWYHDAKAAIAAAGVVVEESKEETI